MKVSWDDYSHILWKNNPNVPNHQPEDVQFSPSPRAFRKQTVQGVFLWGMVNGMQLILSRSKVGSIVIII
jgi:hypothetical protein